MNNAVSQIINALGETVTINNVKKYIMGNAVLCDIIVIFLYGFSCFACFFEFFKISLIEILPTFSDYIFYLPDSIFFWTGAFCLFVLLYFKQHGEIKQVIYSALLLIVTFTLRILTINLEVIPENYISLIPVLIVFMPVLLLNMFSNISEKDKQKNIHNV